MSNRRKPRRSHAAAFRCRGLIFSDQMAAEIAMRTSVAYVRLVETPYVFLCTEGHWHYAAQAAEETP